MKKGIQLIIWMLIISTSTFAQSGGKCISLDGSNDYVSLTSGVYFDDNTFTIEAWVYVRSVKNYARLMDFGASGQDNVWAAVSTGTTGKPAFDVYQSWNGSGQVKSSEAITLNKWTHLAFVKDGSNAYIYMDGRLVGQGTNLYTPRNVIRTKNYIGKSGWDDPLADMMVDEFRIWTTARTQAEVNTNMYKELSTTTNLLVYYKMNEGSGNTLTDDSGNSQTGRLNYGPAWKRSGALAGPRQSLDFDGINDYIKFNNSPTYNNSAFAVEAWIKSTATGIKKEIVNWGSTTTYDVVEFRMNDGKLQLGIDANGWRVVTSSSSINTGKWTHVAAVKNGDNVSLYINGILDATGDISKNPTVNTMAISKFYQGGIYWSGYEFAGCIDEVRIWNQTRSEAQIRECMSHNLTGNESGLEAYYRMDNTTGTTLYDISAGDHHGTLTNMDAATDWISSGAFNTWVGSKSILWNETDNWSRNALPLNSDNVSILSGDSSLVNIDGAAANYLCNSGTLIINPAQSLSLDKSLYNLADSTGLIINSDATGTGQLKVSGTAQGRISFLRYLTGKKFHLFAPPVDGQNITRFLTNPLNSNISTGTVTGSVTKVRGLADYNPALNKWNSFFTNTTSGDLALGKGYELRTKNSVAGWIETTGTVRTTDLSISLSKNWNCVGNPFTTAIAITTNAQATNNLLNQIKTSLHPSFACIYYWDQATSGTRYQVMNNISCGSNECIQAGQAFFIRMNNAGTINLTTAMQQIATTLPFRGASLSDWKKLEILATTGDEQFSTQVAYNEAMTKGLDVTYDAGLLSESSDFQLYTRLPVDNGEKFCLQALPYDADSVSVGLDYTLGGEVTFTTKDVPEGLSAILEDRLMGKFIDLNQTANGYTTTVAANTRGTGRFFLYTNKNRISTHITPTGSESPFTAYASAGVLCIRGELSEQAIATLYNLNGVSAQTNKMSSGRIHNIPLQVKAGTYILKIQNNNCQHKALIIVK